MAEGPDISVLMPVHNAQRFLEAAVRSILEQTCAAIEIIAVDDASSDGSPQILARLAREDRRLRVETLPVNRGIVGALNHGLALARAPLVARMDADDIARPDRLAIQKAYLDAHPEVTMVTASVRRMTLEGRVFHARAMALDDFAVRWMLRFYQTLWHPTYVFRRVSSEGNPWTYDSRWLVSEDYDLSVRMLEQGKVVCLPDFLLDYRVHGGSITGTKAAQQAEEGKLHARRVQLRHLPPGIAAGLEPVLRLQYDRPAPDGALVAAAARGLRAMIRHDLKSRPDLRCWMWRQAAVILAEAAKRAGARGGALLMLRHAPDFAVHAGLRLAERRLEGRSALLRCQPAV